MNKAFSTIVMLLLFCGSITFAQSTEELKALALRDAKTASQATLKMDFDKLLDYTYPSILELMGGKEKAIELLKSTFNTMKESGFVFEKAEILGVSDVVFEDDQYRCYIEGFNQMVMSGKRMKSKSYLFGIYNSEAKFWYFMEAKQLKNEAMMNLVFPNFKTSLKIPEDEMTTEDI
ncbi:hypothetical protein Q4Q39_05110 [Flavivirga amylovorans]|uniref:Nuclear transport factor 2 family protein n=1 Tax=Flavivirga amylovorans TaxID=870486 RepID=A0ABT8WZ53_9FLAO|nr:hypothetical protein [Flavivirga amylovorans]MDO5986782.1 hypothetical protein [Flavivirga amylovorans]